MQLTSHFTLAEMCASQTADRLELDNTPPQDVIERLTGLCHGLEMIRDGINMPINVSSGYRSPAVNAAAGGRPSSQHQTGEAADITSPSFGDPRKLMNWIIGSFIPFDQCILEFYQPATVSAPARGWVHVSFTYGTPRGMKLVIDNTGTREYIA